MGRDSRRNESRPKLNHHLLSPAPDKLEKALSVHEEIFQRVLRLPGVTAVDVGYAVLERKRQFIDLLAIRIHVKRKLLPSDLEGLGWPNLTDGKRYAAQKIVNEFPILGVEITQSPEDENRLCVDGVPLDIIEAKYHPFNQIHIDQPKLSVELEDAELQRISRGRVNTLVGGVSLGSSNGQSGTLGAVVWDRTDASPCVLSNWHVLAGSLSAEVGQPSFQPAIFDGGNSSDVVARLKRWCFGRHGDAALAEIVSQRNYCSGEILGFWHPISGTMKPQLNMTVCKWGRTTGFTEGFIDGIHLATNIDYGGGLVRYFQDQIHIAPLHSGREFSAGGDSGSLIVARFKPDGAPMSRRTQSTNDEERLQNRVYYAVGLLFAGDAPGSQFGEYGIATSAESLEEKLEFSFQPLFVPRSSIRPQVENFQRPNMGAVLPQGTRWRGPRPYSAVPGGTLKGGSPQPDAERLGAGGGGGTSGGGGGG
ncbi:MAG: S1 family peptidase [Deltaproteobacteria bacterium]|nr:S1 family peptidase [Deltaproteobacteria bacterium]